MVRHRWFPPAIVALIFVLILGVYFYNITGWLKEDDEGTALYAAWRFAEGETPYRDLTTTKGPLFLLVGAGLNRILGPSILGLRAATALAIVVSGYLWFHGLRAVYGVLAGTFGASVFLLAPQIYHLGRVFRADSWMLALVACALSACLLGCQRKQRRWLLLSGGLFGLAMLVKVLTIMPFLGCALFLALQTLLGQHRREGVLRFVAFTAPFLIVAVLGFGLAELATPGAWRMIMGSQGTEAREPLDWGVVIVRALVVYATFAKSTLVTILALPFIQLVFPLRRVNNLGLLFLCQLLAASILLGFRGVVYPRYLAYTVLGLSGFLAMGISHFMWKKPENPTVCGGDEWQAGIWGRQPPGAFSLEEAPPQAAGFFTAQEENRFRYAVVVGFVLLAVTLNLFQSWEFLTRSESGTLALAKYIAQNTTPDAVILSDYAELAFHAQRRSVPQTGGIGFGWVVSGLITGEELITAIEQHHVSLIALHVPGGSEPPGDLYYLQDRDAFYHYVQTHYQRMAQMIRTGQLFEIYCRSVRE